MHTKKSIGILYSTLYLPYTNCSVKAKDKQKVYTQGKLSLSINTSITDNLGVGLDISIRNKVNQSVEKNAISLSVWYKF